LLAVPFVLVPAAAFAATGAGWLASHAGAWHRIMGPVAAGLLTVLLAASQYSQGARGSFERAVLAPATNTAWQADEKNEKMSASRHDLVVCNDEMACQLYLGRVDYWLLQSSIADDYLVGSDRRSLYTGARVVSDARALDAVICGARGGVSIALFDTDKFGSDESRQTALDAARRHGGTVSHAGGRNLLVRLPREVMHCQGEPS
jgi:hypothetical protein